MVEAFFFFESISLVPGSQVLSSNLNWMIDIFKCNCHTKSLLARQIQIKEKIFLKLLPLGVSLISFTLK